MFIRKKRMNVGVFLKFWHIIQNQSMSLVWFKTIITFRYKREENQYFCQQTNRKYEEMENDRTDVWRIKVDKVI